MTGKIDYYCLLRNICVMSWSQHVTRGYVIRYIAHAIQVTRDLGETVVVFGGAIKSSCKRNKEYVELR